MQKFKDYHPVVNFIYILIALILSMCAINPYTAGLSLSLALVYGGYLYRGKFFKGMAVLAIPILVSSLLIIPLFSHNGVTALFYINDLPVTLEMIFFDGVTACMVLGVIAWFYVASSMIDTEKFLYLFGRILPTVALVLSMALRMLPLFVKRYKEVGDAQKGLGRDPKDMSLWARSRLAVKKLSIVVSWSLENSMNTTISMESRGYGLKKRTSAHLFKFGRSDGRMGLILAVLGAYPLVVGLGGGFQVQYFPEIHVKLEGERQLLALILMGFFFLVPMIVDVIAEEKERRAS